MLKIITGLSGAGHSTALAALQDIGFETIDNLPISLIPALLEHKTDSTQPLAVGIDSRTADIFTESGQQVLQQIPDAEIIFLDCQDIVLQRRFSVTRRKHPLEKTGENSSTGNILQIIQQERALLKPIKKLAHQVLDTSDLAPHQLSRIMRHYHTKTSDTIKIVISSFSYGNGLPNNGDMVFDMRYLKNPHYQPDLREKTGLDKAVQDHIQQDARFEATADAIKTLVTQSLEGFQQVGKHYCHFAFGCTGGKHRSVFMAAYLAGFLREAGWAVLVEHKVIKP